MIPPPPPPPPPKPNLTDVAVAGTNNLDTEGLGLRMVWSVGLRALRAMEFRASGLGLGFRV